MPASTFRDDRIGSHVRTKLVSILGEEEAQRIASEVLREAGLAEVKSAQDRHRFGTVLARRGGIFTMLGLAIQTQALLHGAQP